MKEKFKVKIYQESGIEQQVEDIIKVVERFFNKEAEIGKGDFSKVYKNYLNTTCFKVFTSKFEQIRTADEEADLLSQLANLNQRGVANTPIPLYSVTPINRRTVDPIIGRGFFVMQRIEGNTLREIIDRKIEIPKSFKFDDFFMKCENFLKMVQDDFGIYHRDIHSGNVMMELKTGEPFIIDFGNSAVFTKNQKIKIDNGEINPYAVAIKGKIFNLQNDFDGLEKIKKEMKKLLTKGAI